MLRLPTRRLARTARPRVFETLEPRQLLAGDWKNPVVDTDVDYSGFAALNDLLIVVSDLRENGNPHHLEPPSAENSPPPFLDVTGEDIVSVADLLAIVSDLRKGLAFAAPDLTAALTNDTGTPGDGRTSDSRIGGQLAGVFTSETRIVGRLDGEAWTRLPHSESGAFTFSPNLATDGSANGPHEAEIIAQTFGGPITRVLIPFTLETDLPADAIVLTEGSNFVVEALKTVPLNQSNAAKTLRFQVDATFDETDASPSVEDLFSVYLARPSNPSQTLLDRGQAGTSLFSLAGERAEFVPGLVRWDGRTVEIDVSNISNASQGQLIFQLLNSDGDDESRVVVHSFDEELEATSAPLVNASRDLKTIAGPLDLAMLSEALDVQVLVENIRFNSRTGRYTAELRLKTTETPLGRTLAVLFPDLPAGVELVTSSGVDSSGNPYINLADTIPRGGLGATSVSQPVEIAFDNPDDVRFAIRPRVLAGPSNQPPVLSAVGPLSVLPGQTLSTPIAATDPDGDGVTFAIRSAAPLPTGMLRGDGTLEFTPTPEQVGSYQFTLVASDGTTETTQDVTLTVNADPLTTTRLTGVILDIDENPLAGMQVEIGAVQGLTQGDGSFTLDLGSGPLVSDTLKVRGELFPGPVAYPFIAEKLPLVLEHEVFLGVNNVIKRPIFLPPLDVANGKQINPMQDTLVTTAAIPGASVFVEAGTLMNQQGTPFDGVLSITEVPPERTPAALPPDAFPAIVVTIQPGEMVFAAPAPLTLPNRDGFAPRTKLDLWSINPTTGQFDRVGQGEVTGNGRNINTISGGIRNSSWHYFSPSGPTPNPDDDNNSDDGCGCCPATTDATSQVETYTGALREWHDLATYQSQGVSRGVSLHYDSLRADPRPIIHFSYSETASSFNDLLLIARLSITAGSFEYQAPGFQGQRPGLVGGEHFWKVPRGAPEARAALQADIRHLPSGVYDYAVQTRIARSSSPNLAGFAPTMEGKFIHVNSIASPFGSGWGIAGLQELVVNSDGSVLLIDGDGSELLFQRPESPGATYVSPPGDFSRLEQLPSGVFRRTTKDQTVYEFNERNQLAVMRDRNGNETKYLYDVLGNLDKIVDPVGLETRFNYNLEGRVFSIIDPANRTTNLFYDDFGNLVGVRDADFTDRTWEYDHAHRLTAEIDKRGFREETSYDFAGRVTQATRKDGGTVLIQPAQTSFLYPPEATVDPANAPPVRQNPSATSRVVESNGRVVETRHDRAGQAVSQRDTIGGLPSVTRNSQHLVTRSRDGRGNAAFFEHDARGNTTRIEEHLLTEDQLKVYVHDLSRRLFTINTATAELTLVGSTSAIMFDLAVSPAGELFGIDDTGRLYRISSTGETTLIADTGPDQSALAFSPDGKLFAANTSLVQIDEESGQTTVIGDGNLDGFAAAGDLAFTADGRLLMTTRNDKLVEVDPTTAAVTVIGDLGFNELLGLIVGVDETVYGFTAAGELILIDLQTGAGSLVARLNGTTFGRIGGAGVASPSPANAVERTFTYDSTFNQVTSMTDERQLTTTFDIDPLNGNIRAIHRPLGHNTFFTYTASGQVDTTTDALERVTDYDYDLLGRLMTVTFAKGTADEARQDYEYDLAGNVIATIDENRHRTEYRYDQMNRLRVVTQADPDGLDGSQESPVTSYGYDDAGNLVSLQDANEVVTTYGFDEVGRMIEMTAPDPDGAGPAGPSVTRYEYDFAGNLVATIDPLGHTTRNRYDARSRLMDTIDPNGGRTRFQYDVDGNLTALTDPVNNTTAFGYDSRDRLVAETDPLGKSIRYEYDGANNLTHKFDRNSRETRYDYDALNRLRTETWIGGGNTISYDYDLLGNLTTVSDQFSRLVFTYDNRDRTETVDNTGTPGAPNVVLNYSYDAAGNVVAVTDTIDGAAGALTSYSYDDLDRLTQLTQSGLGISDKRVNFTYNRLGQYTAINRYSDLSGTQLVIGTDYAYDGQNRLTRLDHQTAQGSTIAFYDYVYDVARRITRITDVDGMTNYGFDDRSQLTSANRSAPNSPDEQYQYDANGNRIESHVHGSAYNTGSANRLLSDGNYHYEYDNEGNMIRRIRIADTESDRSIIREFQWDYRNRLVAVIDKDENEARTQEVNFTYDVINRRISRSLDAIPSDAIDAVLTHYVYDREDVLLDIVDDDGGGPNVSIIEKRFLHGSEIDQVLAQDGSMSAVGWLLGDHLGSIREETDNAGMVKNRLRYSSFGDVLHEISESLPRFRFTSREYDAELDLYYYRNRWYSSNIGQFLSEDPTRVSGAEPNLLRYVFNQPTYWIDPTGLTASCPTTPRDCERDSTTWEPYPDIGGGEDTYHCGFDCFRERNPNPWPQQECCYDDNGVLVGPDHPYAGCGGSPNDYPWWDPRHFGPWDPGGPWERGREGRETTDQYDRDRANDPPITFVPVLPPTPIFTPAPNPTTPGPIPVPVPVPTPQPNSQRRR